MRVPQAIALGLLVLGTGCVRQKLNDIALRPSGSIAITPEDFGLAYEVLHVPVDGALIHAWFFPAEEADAAVLICGGNSGNKSLFLPLAREVVAEGYHAVMFDYRGYGLSGGAPDLWSLVPDAHEVLRAVRARPDVSMTGVIGLSLGSVVAMGVADRAPHEVAAVAVEGTFLPSEMLDGIAGGFLGTLGSVFVIPSGWDVEDHAEDLSAPMLFIHGPEDWVTPLPPVARVYAEADGSGPIREMWLAEGAGHVPGIAGTHGRELVTRMTRFFDTFVKRTAPDLRIRAAWNRPEGGPVEIDLVPQGELFERAPVEVAAVFPDEEMVFRRVWVAPGIATRVSLPATVDPVLVTASIPPGPVAPEGDGWRRSGLYIRSRRALERHNKDLQRTLGGKVVMRAGGEGFSIDPEEERSREVRLADAREVEAELDNILGGEVHPWIRPLYADFYLTIGEIRIELEDAPGARRALTRYLDLVPADPNSWFWFGDASWWLGWDLNEVAEVHEKLALTAVNEDERIAHMARAAECRAKVLERARWLEAWGTRQREGAK